MSASRDPQDQPCGAPKSAAPDAARSVGWGANRLARRFHELYEQLAPNYGYKTRRESAVPWEKVPEKNRLLMIAVCCALLDEFLTPDAPEPTEQTGYMCRPTARLHAALYRLAEHMPGADMYLLAGVGSIGDTLPDADCADHIEDWLDSRSPSARHGRPVPPHGSGP